MYFPTAVQNFDNPLSSADSTWGARVHRFQWYYQVAKTSRNSSRRVSFPSLGDTLFEYDCSWRDRSYSTGHLELFTRFPNGIPKEMSGSLWIPASSQCSFALFPRHRLDHPSRPFRTSDVAPDEHNYRDSNVRIILRCSIARHLSSLSTLRSDDCSIPTQDSLPVVGQTLPCRLILQET